VAESTAIPKRVHIVGAGGAGMSGLAKLLSQLGHDVSGSDLKPGRMLDSLNDVGVRTWIGHRPEAVTDVELMVVSSAVPDSDPELKVAAASGVEIWRRPALLSNITSGRRTIGFAGTHGKTTSTALAVRALRGSGHDPSFLVGGEMIGLNTGASLGTDDVMLLEADEAFGTFRHLDLDSLLVTNIEADHLDHYGSVAALEDAFAQVAAGVSGAVMACIDDAGVRRLAQRTELTTYGFSDSADYRIVELGHSDAGVSFTLVGPTSSTAVRLPKPGEHLASNAAGVLALLEGNGFDLPAAADALSSFSGVRRRYEIKGKVGGVTIVDDYAHHPTEVAATIAAASYGTTGRVIAVFQPHRYSRTADLGPDFGAPLALADTTFVTDVYPAGERPIIGVSGRLVAEATEAAGGDVRYVGRLGDVASLVTSEAREGDVVLLMGAGDINSIADEIARSIEELR